MISSPANIVQNCYVVADLDAACAKFHHLYGIGPFVGGEPVSLDNHVYRGKPAPPIELRGVFVQAGEINIELVQILSSAPSAFHDMFASGEEGFHHVAMFCDDYAASKTHFENMGYAIASEFIIMPEVSICYVDARPALGHMIELYTEHPLIRAMYEQTRKAALDCDRPSKMVPWQLED